MVYIKYINDYRSFRNGKPSFSLNFLMILMKIQ